MLNLLYQYYFKNQVMHDPCFLREIKLQPSIMTSITRDECFSSFKLDIGLQILCSRVIKHTAQSFVVVYQYYCIL